jgi:glucose-6-phosphate 1-epimerase
VLANQLATQFDIPNALRVEDSPGGLVRAVISTPAAEAIIYLHGAHVTHWTPRGQRPVLFLSPKSLFAPGKPIRGGVPVIFPWFGPRGDGQPGPMHGFARITEWKIGEAKLRHDGNVEITFELAPDDSTRGFGYGDFHVRIRVTVGSELEMELEVRNLAETQLRYEEALHSYFAIGDIQQASITGLEGAYYVDKTDGFKRKQREPEPMRFTKETDQVYLNTTAACVIHDPVWSRRIMVEKSGSDTTVVWNPWIEKTKTMSDMASDDWKEMVCVETANASENAVHLAPGAARTMKTMIRVR